MKEIKMKNGKVALVDDDDFPFLNEYKWNAQHSPRRTEKFLGKKYAVRMHRVIMNAPRDKFVDHIDGNPLNNQKANLRLCSSLQNNFNMKIGRRNTTGFKGIQFHKDTKTWSAQISVNKKTTYIGGGFKTAVDAAKAYDEAAVKLHGEFARTNAYMGFIPS